MYLNDKNFRKSLIQDITDKIDNILLGISFGASMICLVISLIILAMVSTK
jgi:hypothetical protein|nr:MAG TPA: hypothetical protein [Caudoviricetes sp.]